MKTKMILGFVLTLLNVCAFAQPNETQGVSIAPDETPPSKDAMLDIISSHKGVLVPRVDEGVIGGSGDLRPAYVKDIGQHGLLVFVTNANANYGYWYFDDISDTWKKLASGTGGDLWVPNSGNMHNENYATNKVGIGITSPVAKLHVSLASGDDIFIAQSSKQSLGLYDYYSSIGPGRFLLQKSLVQSNTWYSHMDHTGFLRMVLASNWTTGGTPWGQLGFRNNLTYFRNAAGAVVVDAAAGNMQLSATGSIWANSSILSTSDSLLKTDFDSLDNMIDEILELQGYTYKWRDTAMSRDMQYGLLAQNVQRVFPTLVNTVSYQKVLTDSTFSTSSRLALNYEGIIPILLEGIKEQQDMIDALEAQVSTLEEAVADLLGRVEALETP